MNYRPFEVQDTDEVKDMIRQYYHEDHPEQEMRDDQIQKTLDEFIRYPEKGTVLLLLQDSEVVGYSIIIYFWSNELGGDIVNIDELFVKKDHRGHGIGSGFVQSLIRTRFHGCVGLELVTTSQNERARQLYANLGFAASSDSHMEYRF